LLDLLNIGAARLSSRLLMLELDGRWNACPDTGYNV